MEKLYKLCGSGIKKILCIRKRVTIGMRELWENDKVLVIKKSISVILILIGMIFVFANKKVYYSDYVSKVKIPKADIQNPIIVEFQGDKVFEQEFKGWSGALTSVSLRVENQGNQAASGMITLNILDDAGNLLQTTHKKISKVKTTKPFYFNFKEPKQLIKDKWYVLQVVVQEAENPQGFGFLTYAEKKMLFGQLTEDGVKVENRLGATFKYHYYNMRAAFNMCILLLFALAFVLFPFWKIDSFVEQKWNKKIDCNKMISRLFFLASPVLCYMMADRFNGYYLSRMIKRMHSEQFLFNLLIYFVLWVLIYTIVNRTQYASIILLVGVFVATIANYYVWIFRGCPILATDLQSAKTAMNVAANFSYALDLTGVWGVVYIIAFVAMLLSLKGYKGFEIKGRCTMVVCSIAAVLLFKGVFFQSDIVKRCGIKAEVWHPQQSYDKNGTALSFVLSWSYTKVEKPSGYSAKKIASVVEQYQSDEVIKADGDRKKPNIIAIMNESLADLEYNGKLDLSEDYLPFLHSLKENTVKGKLYVSIEGANTANSEFEFLTGNTMAFLPFRCIPYNLYINQKTPSMAQNIGVQGYTGMGAYHPYKRSGWNRENVYPLLGFDDFYSEEYYYENGNDSLVRNYISDESDFKQIIEDYEAARASSNDPFYLFNVTMQNHGGYDGKRGYVETDITIEDPEQYDIEAEQYINLAKMSDKAFKQLVKYFENVEEPTLIVMFGDHQPPISNSFYSKQYGKNVNDLPVKKQAEWYATPYVIWANYDIEEMELDMSANYLSSYVLNMAGLQLSGYNKYLLDLQKTLPVISAVCYMDTKGNIYEIDEHSEYSDLIKEYQMIQYNELFDEENRYEDFFFIKDEE